MKRYICLIGIVALVMCMMFSSCKKYEEDYGLMMKTPKGRLVGTWKITQVDFDTTSIKFSDFAMFGELLMTFEKDETGYIKFNDKGLGDILSDTDWEELMGELQDSTANADSVSGGLDDVDFSALLSSQIGFKWAFDDKKELIRQRCRHEDYVALQVRLQVALRRRFDKNGYFDAEIKSAICIKDILKK